MGLEPTTFGTTKSTFLLAFLLKNPIPNEYQCTKIVTDISIPRIHPRGSQFFGIDR